MRAKEKVIIEKDDRISKEQVEKEQELAALQMVNVIKGRIKVDEKEMRYEE